MVNRTEHKLNMSGDAQDTITPQAGAAGSKQNMACREPCQPMALGMPRSVWGGSLLSRQPPKRSCACCIICWHVWDGIIRSWGLWDVKEFAVPQQVPTRSHSRFLFSGMEEPVMGSDAQSSSQSQTRAWKGSFYSLRPSGHWYP